MNEDCGVSPLIQWRNVVNHKCGRFHRLTINVHLRLVMKDLGMQQGLQLVDPFIGGKEMIIHYNVDQCLYSRVTPINMFVDLQADITESTR